MKYDIPVQFESGVNSIANRTERAVAESLLLQMKADCTDSESRAALGIAADILRYIEDAFYRQD